MPRNGASGMPFAPSTLVTGCCCAFTTGILLGVPATFITLDPLIGLAVSFGAAFVSGAVFFLSAWCLNRIY